MHPFHPALVFFLFVATQRERIQDKKEKHALYHQKPAVSEPSAHPNGFQGRALMTRFIQSACFSFSVPLFLFASQTKRKSEQYGYSLENIIYFMSMFQEQLKTLHSKIIPPTEYYFF